MNSRHDARGRGQRHGRRGRSADVRRPARRTTWPQRALTRGRYPAALDGEPDEHAGDRRSTTGRAGARASAKWVPILVLAPSLVASFIYVFVFTALDLLHLALGLDAAADLRLRRLRQLRGALVEPALEHRLHQPLPVQRLLRRRRDGGRPPARDPDRPAHPRRSRPGARSSSIRWRSPSSSPARSGAGSTTRPPASSSWCAALGWTSFEFALTTDRELRDLRHHPHRHLAVLGLRHGAVPRRAALGRPGPHQGRADRRRRLVPHLPQGDPALDRADLRRRRGGAAAVRHQDLRPRGGADRRRPGHLDHLPGDLRLRPHVPARRRSARARRRRS